MKSENRWKEILDNRNWSQKTFDKYIEKPIFYDLIIGSILILSHFVLTENLGSLVTVDSNVLSDLLNELVSSSLSAGGFVLAALAIIASIKQGVEKPKDGQRPKDGKELFYNSKAYENVVKMYSLCCVVFVFLFILFVVLRTSVSSLNQSFLLHILIFGITILVLSFLRCIYLLWLLIRIR